VCDGWGRLYCLGGVFLFPCGCRGNCPPQGRGLRRPPLAVGACRAWLARSGAARSRRLCLLLPLVWLPRPKGAPVRKSRKWVLLLGLFFCLSFALGVGRAFRLRAAAQAYCCQGRFKCFEYLFGYKQNLWNCSNYLNY